MIDPLDEFSPTPCNANDDPREEPPLTQAERRQARDDMDWQVNEEMIRDGLRQRRGPLRFRE